jgi:hypothetical protein
MNKILCFLISLLISANLNAFATGIEILPTMTTKTNSQDRVWVGTFQLAWNDFIDKIVFNPIRFREGTPLSVIELNKKGFDVNNLSEDCYYKYTGKIKKNTKKTIARGLRRTLKETSDILDKLDFKPGNDRFIIYAMLKKDFEFVNAFDKLGTFNFKNVPAEYFGISEDSDKKLLSQGVTVLFYNNSNDFAVKLSTVNEDEVILYKNSINKPFNFIYSDLLIKQKNYRGKTGLSKADDLKIPNITFFEEKIFDELIDKRIMGTNLIISQAIESVKFNLDNKGVQLKSEAGLTAEVTSLLPPEKITPRHFYFNNTFVVFIKEKGKKKPYFALRVNDITKFQAK